MLPSAGLSQSNNLVCPRSNPQEKKELISKPQENKTKIIKFNWRDFLWLSKVNLNWERNKNILRR